MAKLKQTMSDEVYEHTRRELLSIPTFLEQMGDGYAAALRDAMLGGRGIGVVMVNPDGTARAVPLSEFFAPDA